MIVSHGGGATADRLAGLPSMRARRESRGKGLKGGTARQKRGKRRVQSFRLGKDFFVVSIHDAWTGDDRKIEERREGSWSMLSRRCHRLTLTLQSCRHSSFRRCQFVLIAVQSSLSGFSCLLSGEERITNN